MENMKTLEAAKQNGYYSLALLLGAFIAQGYLIIMFPEDTLMLAVVTAVLTLAVTYTYWIMMLGIATMADETGDQTFIVSTNNFIRAVIITCVLAASIGLIEELRNEIVSGILSLVLLVSFVYLGVVSLKIAKGFKALEGKYGKTAKRAIFWHKVSGYLMVTVILSFIGIITSLVADFFMWRLICRRLEDSNATTSDTLQ